MSNNAKGEVEAAMDRCGWMREGCDRLCKLEAGHVGVHEWESEDEMLTRASIGAQDDSGDEEGLQEMPQMSIDSGHEIQG